MSDAYELLKSFFDRSVCQRATAPLKSGIEISVQVGDVGPYALKMEKGRLTTLARAAKNPDMSFVVTPQALRELNENPSEDIGEIGVAILKAMASTEPNRKISAKVHIGGFELLRNGYFGVLPLGGATVMKFLATKGFGGIGKIREGIARFRQP